MLLPKLADDFFQATVHGFTRLDGGSHHAAMSHHIHIGEVEHDEIVLTRIQPGNHFVGHL